MRRGRQVGKKCAVGWYIGVVVTIMQKHDSIDGGKSSMVKRTGPSHLDEEQQFENARSKMMRTPRTELGGVDRVVVRRTNMHDLAKGLSCYSRFRDGRPT